MSSESTPFFYPRYTSVTPSESTHPTWPSSQESQRTITFGIETEFVLIPLHTDLYPEKREGFNGVSKAAKSYALFLEREKGGLYSMQSRDGRNLNTERTFNKYIMCTDPSIEHDSKDSRMFGAELISPLFSMTNGSDWLAEYELTWKWLKENYTIIPNETCATHVHVSIEGGFSLDDAKKIAMCVMLFGPAMEAIIPEHLRGEYYAKNNWANNDLIGALPGKYQSLSRREAVQRLARRGEFCEVVNYMNSDLQKTWAWNFLNLLDHPDDVRHFKPGDRPLGTIEFRQAPISTTFEEALQWIEFATSFVKAAVLMPDPLALIDIPPTVGNLRTFVENRDIPKGPVLSDPLRMARLWEGDSRAWKVPRPWIPPHLRDEAHGPALTELHKNIELEWEEIEYLIKRSAET